MAKKQKKSDQDSSLEQVIHKYVKKDRVSTYLEKLLNQTHTNFESLEDLLFDQEDYVELLFLLEESDRQDEKRKVNLAVNETILQIEELKNKLFILEKVLLDSLGIGSNIPADDIPEDISTASTTPLLDESLENLNNESISSENVNIEISSSSEVTKDLDKATEDSNSFSEDSEHAED